MYIIKVVHRILTLPDQLCKNGSSLPVELTSKSHKMKKITFISQPFSQYWTIAAEFLMEMVVFSYAASLVNSRVATAPLFLPSALQQLTVKHCWTAAGEKGRQLFWKSLVHIRDFSWEWPRGSETPLDNIRLDVFSLSNHT